MDDPERIRNLNVIQDFNNKKANAHAAIFVASMFALFTVLSLAQRIVVNVVNDTVNLNLCILILSSVSYWLIWFFGLYSIGNFTYYSTVAQKAEEGIIGYSELNLIKEHLKGWKGFFKFFASFKIKENKSPTLNLSETIMK